MKNPLHARLCKICGATYGLHKDSNEHCPQYSTQHFLTTSFDEKIMPKPTKPCKEPLCRHCGSPYGKHSPDRNFCPIPDDPDFLKTTFELEEKTTQKDIERFLSPLMRNVYPHLVDNLDEGHPIFKFTPKELDEVGEGWKIVIDGKGVELQLKCDELEDKLCCAMRSIERGAIQMPLSLQQWGKNRDIWHRNSSRYEAQKLRAEAKELFEAQTPEMQKSLKAFIEGME